MKKLCTLLTVFLKISLLSAQNGIIRGTVRDAITNDPLPFANVVIKTLNKGATTDENGRFEITGIPPGLYNVEASYVGYISRTEFEVQVTQARPAVINFRLRENTAQLSEVTVTAQNSFNRSQESPVSLNTIGINEIQRNPGANQDISRVIQSLPGVASTPNFRNDIIIRGGAPNENRFYLDGIEIPSINHFGTQGSSGGPVGLINVQTIREVDFYTGAFPVERSNALSSVMDIKLKEGNEEKLKYVFQVGASEAGLTVDGPLSPTTTFVASARRSYLQFLFSLLDLPFLPTYNDFQFKTRTKLTEKSQLVILGLGAIDYAPLNANANETEEQRYILSYLPVFNQWNYSIGARYTYFGKKSFTNVVLSRFMLNNESFKYPDNNETLQKLLDYRSREIENKLRIENFARLGRLKITTGGLIEEVKYNTSTVDRRFANGFVLDYASDLVRYKYGAFAQVSGSLLNGKIDYSAGVRAEGLNFNNHMANPLNQLSPRVSLAWNLTSEWSLNANWGIYYQLPPFPTLGFRDRSGALVNTDARYIRADHYITGITWYPITTAKVSLEGFYKKYFNYPFLLRDSISLANLGSDFGVIGNAPASFTNQGRAYGLELSYQQKLYKGFFGIFAITAVRSEFQDKNGIYLPSAWDNRLIATVTFGKKFGRNWELGVQYQFLGGAPYTPIDTVKSGFIPNFQNNPFGFPDFNRINSQRVESFHRLNARIDKKWFFPRYNLNIYFDIQNALGLAPQGPPRFDAVRDESGRPVMDPNDPTRYLTRLIPSSSTGPALPSVGLIVDF
ncbi:TonB-dependent receptor [Schleiferia thermophila]|jgi:hypothetical protein|uniref:TonB-dependent receptor n=1 Tax=Schleiferia thermophila TaxID=884107 RepID=UPI0004E78423|nr:TonB-dependent receptor [Schleiferia thermophila]KFD40016.1 ferric aerobactin receptor [Schleiferia thermophila str. Yellowstone]